MDVLPVFELGAALGIDPRQLVPYGRHKAKVELAALDGESRNGRLILVSAITPTPAGEGKTTTTIGLGQALARIGESVCLALREPSLGPCFGVKGGGTGGGRCRVEPSADINLHFNGDLHAVSSAHNLLAAMVDNHLHFRLDPPMEARRVVWKRVVDMNDRSLRNIIIGLGGPREGVARESGFDITAASEVMAALCLSESRQDLRARLSRLIVAFAGPGKSVTAEDIGATGAMLALLDQAICPNLVRTTEGVPAFVHGGPFANIAHGCNSILATRMALHHADWAVTEAGFGFGLGAEKFFDIKCQNAGLDTAAVVLVATIRALKMHGGVRRGELAKPDLSAVRAGLPNLDKHIESIRCFTEIPVVALNRFASDTDDEIDVVRQRCQELGVPFAVSDHFAHGGDGAIELARLVVEHAEKHSSPFVPLYRPEDSALDKITAVANKMYGAEGVVFSKVASRELRRAELLGYGKLPVCLAKTSASLSGDPTLLGRPVGFELPINGVRINAGAGFLVVMVGDIVRMPGLPRVPSALDVDVVDGVVVGVE